MKKACISMATLMMVAFLSFSLVSCGDDDDPWTNAPDDDVRVDPDVPVPDPEGTLELSMSPGGNALDDEFYIDKNYNFRYYYHNAYGLDPNYGKNTMFTPLSTVNGLGNINYIPVVAWVDQVAAIKGRGYVAYSPRKDKFYRLYVEPDTISGSSSSRYIVRYQMPFLGTDEEIKLDEKTITFDAEESEQALLFNNENILVYTCESSESWCRVYKCSDMEYGFLNNGVMIHVLPSDRSEPRTATVTLKTAYGKETQISVTQAGMEPYIRVNGNEEVSVSSFSQTISLDVSSNYSIDDIEVTSDKNWCIPSIIDETDYMQSKAAKVKSVKGVEEQSLNNARRYKLDIEVHRNLDVERKAIITLRGKDGKASASFTLTQSASSILLTKRTETVVANSGSLSFTCISPTSGDYMTVSCDSSWCTPSITKSTYRNSDSYDITITLSYDANYSEKERSTDVKLAVNNSSISVTFTLVQEGLTLDIPDTLWYDRKSRTSTNVITSKLNTLSGWEAYSSEDWCKVSIAGNQLVLRLSDSAEEREATISFKGLSKQLKVMQSKYAVNDDYAEGDVWGTVGYMSGSQRYIYRILPETAAWSTVNVAIGATNRENGMANIAIVKQINDWEELYPAFALCESLNTGGVTGWYMPAINELKNLNLRLNNYTWSSTEYDSYKAYYIDDNNDDRYYNNYKRAANRIIAVRKF